MRIELDTSRVDDYQTFLKVRKLPVYRIAGTTAEFPDEYAAELGMAHAVESKCEYKPSPFLFDYQRDIARISIERRKFCVFADCGLGKTLMMLEFARHAAAELPSDKCVLIISPLMVTRQTLAEAANFYGSNSWIEHVSSAGLNRFLKSGDGKIGITNFEALNTCETRGRLGALIVDESSMLKSHYGRWGTKIVELGRGLAWKLCLTGTPAPNDRIEYATHAVLMDAHPTINSFLAKYFINRGQTDNRWEIKPHALGAFYRDMSHWAIFLSNPETYGWKDHAHDLPPIKVHIHDISLTDQQRDAVHERTGQLFVNELGGIVNRAALATIAKGFKGKEKIDTKKTKAIIDMIASWPNEQTLVWCIYNEEQAIISKALPDAASIYGNTPLEERLEIIDAFKAGQIKTLISKGKILGFGLNLQHVTRQVFSGLQDSYETYYQCVKRSNRYGAKSPLHVHIPVTDIEKPMVDNVLRKAERVQRDTDEQEQAFKNNAPHWRKLVSV